MDIDTGNEITDEIKCLQKQVASLREMNDMYIDENKGLLAELLQFKSMSDVDTECDIIDENRHLQKQVHGLRELNASFIEENAGLLTELKRIKKSLSDMDIRSPGDNTDTRSGNNRNREDTEKRHADSISPDIITYTRNDDNRNREDISRHADQISPVIAQPDPELVAYKTYLKEMIVSIDSIVCKLSPVIAQTDPELIAYKSYLKDSTDSIGTIISKLSKYCTDISYFVQIISTISTSDVTIIGDMISSVSRLSTACTDILYHYDRLSDATTNITRSNRDDRRDMMPEIIIMPDAFDNEWTRQFIRSMEERVINLIEHRVQPVNRNSDVSIDHVSDAITQVPYHTAAFDKQLSDRMDALTRYVTDSIKQLSDRSDVVDKALSDHTAAIDKALSDHTAAIDKALSDHTAAIDKALSDHTAAIDKALSDHTAAIDKQLSDRMDALTRHITDSIRQVPDLTTAIDKQLSDQMDALTRHVTDSIRQVPDLTTAIDKQLSDRMVALTRYVTDSIKQLIDRVDVNDKTLSDRINTIDNSLTAILALVNLGIQKNDRSDKALTESDLSHHSTLSECRLKIHDVWLHIQQLHVTIGTVHDRITTLHAILHSSDYHSRIWEMWSSNADDIYRTWSDNSHRLLMAINTIVSNIDTKIDNTMVTVSHTVNQMYTQKRLADDSERNRLAMNALLSNTQEFIKTHSRILAENEDAISKYISGTH